MDDKYRLDWLSVNIKGIEEILSPIPENEHIIAPVRCLFNYLQDCFPKGSTIDRTTKHARFKHVFAVSYKNETLAFLKIQDEKASNGIFCEVSGDKQQIYSSLLTLFQTSMLNITVSRVDIRTDIKERSLSYETMLSKLRAYGSENNMQRSYTESVVQGELSRTEYLGSRSNGSCFLRWYEKSVKEMVKGDKFNRLEFEFHPKNVRNRTPDFFKQFLFLLVESFKNNTLSKMFAFEPMARDIHAMLTNEHIETIIKTMKPDKKLFKSLAFMFKQYNNTVTSLKEEYHFDIDELFYAFDRIRQVEPMDDKSLYEFIEHSLIPKENPTKIPKKQTNKNLAIDLSHLKSKN